MNSNLKTAGAGLLVAGLIFGSRARREPAIEDDRAARAEIEQTIRTAVTAHNPYASVKPRPLDNFEIIEIQVTRPRLAALGSNRYSVYVRFRESGKERCMTTTLRWNIRAESWSSFRNPNVDDRCEPLW